MGLLELEDADWMTHCNATYKLAIKFTDFYKKGQSLSLVIKNLRFEFIVIIQNLCLQPAFYQDAYSG
jgi:hypothetical protein